MCAGFHCEAEASQNSNRWAGGITEMNLSQLKSASDTLQRFPICSFGVDLWFRINESNDILRGTLRLGKIRRESEYVPSLSARKDMRGCKKCWRIGSTYPPKVTLMRTTKNWKREYSRSAISRAPYQNT